MFWKDEYRINIPIIDTQHKQLFLAYDQLRSELRTGLKASVIEESLIKLQHYVARHFTMEEKYMVETNYPKLQEQQEAHAYFSKRFSDLLNEFEEKGLTPDIVNTIQRELKDWLQNHVATLDMEFGRYHQAHQKAET